MTTTTEGPTLAEDCDLVLATMATAPIAGWTIEQLSNRLNLSYRTVNASLCELGRKVTHARARQRGGRMATGYRVAP